MLLQRRKMCVSRFWQLDDDGVYLVTYSSIKDSAVTPSLTVRLRGGALNVFQSQDSSGYVCR
jgi:hypothetical protein